jgi:hypothetical protein
MRRRRWLLLAIAGSLVVAGCGAGTGRPPAPGQAASSTTASSAVQLAPIGSAVFDSRCVKYAQAHADVVYAVEATYTADVATVTNWQAKHGIPATNSMWSARPSAEQVAVCYLKVHDLPLPLPPPPTGATQPTIDREVVIVATDATDQQWEFGPHAQLPILPPGS